MEPLVAEGLTKRYRVRGKDHTWKSGIRQRLGKEEVERTTALDGASFSVGKGEIFGILGPNGAGKTTLIKMLAGLLLPDSGSATVNGYDIIHDREKVRTSVNILMSGGWVIFDYKLSIHQNLRFWGTANGMGGEELEEAVDRVLEAVGLGEKKKDFPENLSAGLRQRMNLARCLLSERPIYLLDEPTANVDPYSASFIREFIVGLKKQGRTVLLATHNLWEAEMLCDRVAVLNRGKIISLDTTQGLKRSIGEEVLVLSYTRIQEGAAEALSALPWVEKAELKDDKLKLYGLVKSNLLQTLDEARKFMDISRVDVEDASLNEIFMQLMAREEART
ncbi:MAG: ABC transporter ATP-binding protein [Candidatus Thermoplasmatota archaeon]|nr:ABC transporter ATP-binding protein [Candidatus Thermoplasmatota archaeon]